MSAERQSATLGGGCFWCLEAAYEQIAGVSHVVSGYAGGSVANPTYDQVCSGRTGHAEVVQVTFDPEVVTYRDLLDIFFTIHDPTTLNRQGADTGTQYRSVIYYHDEDQRRSAVEAISAIEAQGVWESPIVTEVAPLPVFYPAEEYHQHYYARNPSQGYCRAVIAPKLAKLRKEHFERLVRNDRPANPVRAATGGAGGGSQIAQPYGDPGMRPAIREGQATEKVEGQVRPYQDGTGSPIDQGGIAD